MINRAHRHCRSALASADPVAMNMSGYSGRMWRTPRFVCVLSALHAYKRNGNARDIAAHALLKFDDTRRRRLMITNPEHTMAASVASGVLKSITSGK